MRLLSLILLFLICNFFITDIFSQTTTDGIILKTPGRIIGQNGDSIYNSGSNAWTFSNDTLKNVVIPGLESMASATNTFWVSPGFGNSGKFWSEIQDAIDAAPSPTGYDDQFTIYVLTGNYKGFSCSKSYINIIGMGSPVIDTLYTSTVQTFISGNNVKLENLMFTDNRFDTLNFQTFKMLDIVGGVTINNCNFIYKDLKNTYNSTDSVIFFGIFGNNPNVKNIVIKNSNFNLTLHNLFEPDTWPALFRHMILVDLACSSTDSNTNVIENSNFILKTISDSYVFHNAYIIRVNNSDVNNRYWRNLFKNLNIYINTNESENNLSNGYSIYSETSPMLNEIYSNYGIYVNEIAGNFTYNVFINSNFKIQ